MLTVSLSEEIAALFADAHDDFPTMIGMPSDDDVQRLRQRNFQALHDINLGDGTDIIGLILSEADHKAANENQLFERANIAVEAYNPSIKDNNNAVRLRQEKKWSCNLDRQPAI